MEKTLRLGKIEREEKRATEDEMVGCNHWLSGREFEHTPKCAEHTPPACNSSLVSQEMVKDRAS